jgi:hypothetical protein
MVNLRYIVEKKGDDKKYAIGCGAGGLVGSRDYG